MKKLLFFGIVFCFCISCQQKEQPIVSFYYWKTIFRLSPKEKNCLATNEVKRVYIRYFDIDLNSKTQKPYPRSPIQFKETTFGFEIIPVVYIKNKVMLDSKLNISDLAQKTFSYINQINKKSNINVQEMQIDCDWTLASKDNYLHFIEAFRKVSNKKLSATIRLHQIKYFNKTKIPNVDRGVLMYYNMGKIASDSLNSIYDKDIAKRYLSSLQHYPLPINIALPIYSWGIHIRDGKVIGLLNKIDSKKLISSSFTFTNNSWFCCKKAIFIDGTFFKENDQVKLEKIVKEDLLNMANDLEENSIQNPREIIFYDLDEFNLKNYEENIFKEVINCF